MSSIWKAIIHVTPSAGDLADPAFLERIAVGWADTPSQAMALADAEAQKPCWRDRVVQASAVMERVADLGGRA